MSERVRLKRFDPLPLAGEGLFDRQSDETQLVALTIETKYQFANPSGEIVHEYLLPSNADMHNAGGYVDKLVKYRDPALRKHLRHSGVNAVALFDERFPILKSRSPRLDFLLFEWIRIIRDQQNGGRVSLFDLGCTVCEHWDMLDAMLQAASDGREGAASALSYHGLDKSVMLLSIGRLLHSQVEPQHFQLMRADGAQFDFPPESFDLTLSVGVVNHVSDPRISLERMLSVTRHAAVLALWVTDEKKGFWGMIHSGLAFYVFSLQDLLGLEQIHGGRFYYTDYIPEEQGSQQKSLVGVGVERIKHIGCYHLVFSKRGAPPFQALPLAHAADRGKDL
jgi:SAM-dependent methyltransferase